MPRKRTQAAGPWLLIVEFPRYADAKAAQELISEFLPDPSLLRAKRYNPNSGKTIGEWRMTKILRKTLLLRPFGKEEVEAILLENDYHDTNSYRWMHQATKAGVLERLSLGIYRFQAPLVPQLQAMPCETPAPR